MCKYCDMTLVNKEKSCKEYYIHSPFYLRDEYDYKKIKANGYNPTMYLREYKKTGIWSIICEFADDAGTVVETQVVYCPRCGKRLLGFNNDNICEETL